MDEQSKNNYLRMVSQDVSVCDQEGRRRFGPGVERCITIRQETAFRLCHHDFFGLSYAEAADIMGIEYSTLAELLQLVQAIAPQLFPILTKDQVAVRDMATSGMSVAQIAGVRGVSRSTVRNMLHSLNKKR
jgi:DNA-directed RNA polymerase specialized sigma24 family protein